MAALVHRLVLAGFGAIRVWCFLFADDTLHALLKEVFGGQASFVIGLRLALGDPLALAKIQAGSAVSWVGFRLVLQTQDATPQQANGGRRI